MLLGSVAIVTWGLKRYWTHGLQRLENHTISRARFERLTKRNVELAYLRAFVNGTTILSVGMYLFGIAFSLVTTSCAVVSCAALISQTIGTKITS